MILQAAGRIEPSGETLLAEMLAVRAILLNVFYKLANGEKLTAEEMQGLIDRADRERFRRVADRLEEQAARKKPMREAREKPPDKSQR